LTIKILFVNIDYKIYRGCLITKGHSEHPQWARGIWPKGSSWSEA